MADGQLVFLDESGDAGFKTEKGSSPVLVVAAVIFDSPDQAEETAEAIRNLRQQLGKSQRFQFHFSNLTRNWREQFLNSVSACPFRVRAIVMAKDRIYLDSQLRRRGDLFYNYTVRCLLNDALGRIENAKVFVDGDAGRESLRAMVAYLRRECNTEERCVIKQVKFVPKRENNVLVQLSDMVASGLARSYRTEKSDSRLYRSLLEPRLENLWEFGRGE